MLALMRPMLIFLLLLAAPLRAHEGMLLAPGRAEGCLLPAGPWELDEQGHATIRARSLPASLCPPGAGLVEPVDGRGRIRRLFVFDASEPQRLIAFALRAPARPHWRPETGMWWSLDPQTHVGVPGSGMFLEVQGDAIAVWLASYDETGRAMWWMAAGELDGAVFHGELLGFDGGAPAFTASRPPQRMRPFGQIALLFHAPARAEVWIARGEDDTLTLHTFQASRFVFATPPGVAALAGEWEWSGEDVQPSRQPLRLVPLAGATGELLADLSRWLYLRCDPAAEGVPARCALFDLGRIGAMVEFDAVGLNLLIGRDREGREHRLTRMARPAQDGRENPPPAADGE